MRVARYVIVVVVVLLIIGGLAALKGAQIGSLIQFGEEAMAAGAPPETISAAPVQADTWESTLDTVGSVATSRGVTITAELPGTVVRLRFDSGERVEAGQVLVELDSGVERAQLASITSRRRLAETNLQRMRALTESGAVARAELDTNESEVTTLLADAAALSAEIEKKIIRAPFAGQLGIRQVNLGQYLNPGDPIVTLESVEGLFIDFTLPQRHLADLSVGMRVRALNTETGDGPIEGTLSAITPTIDPLSRAIGLRATVPEGSESLRPGMFLGVSVVLPERRDVLMVPITAVAFATYGDSVFVIEDKAADEPGMRETPDGTPVLIARQHFVRLGQQRGDFVEVLEGVSAGQSVAVEGVFKLQNGSPVVLTDAPTNTAQLVPAVENR